MFEAGGTVLVACSGGPDSVCLLYSLAHLHRLFRIRLAVFHLDHRLREGSDADAAYVRRLADRLDLPSHLRAVSGVPARGRSVEAWARDRRPAAAPPGPRTPARCPAPPLGGDPSRPGREPGAARPPPRSRGWWAPRRSRRRTRRTTRPRPCSRGR